MSSITDLVSSYLFASLEIEASYGSNVHWYVMGTAGLFILLPSIVYVLSRARTRSRHSARRYTLACVLILIILLLAVLYHFLHNGPSPPH